MDFLSTFNDFFITFLTVFRARKFLRAQKMFFGLETFFELETNVSSSKNKFRDRKNVSELEKHCSSSKKLLRARKKQIRSRFCFEKRSRICSSSKSTNARGQDYSSPSSIRSTFLVSPSRTSFARLCKLTNPRVKSSTSSTSPTS